jgi:hypothetical protein
MDPVRRVLRVKRRDRVLEQFRAGRITIRQAAELLGVAYVEMDDILREHRIRLVDDIELGLERALAPPAARGRNRRRSR